MISFEEIKNGILRLKVPFENIYTSVFLVRCAEGDILLDCATTKSDAESIIIPALGELGAYPAKIFCSHSHGDHMGGLPYLAKAFPDAEIYMAKASEAEKYKNAHLISDGDELLEGVEILLLPGHSPDSAGILCKAQKALLTFDAIQLYGISRFGSGIGDGVAYFSTLHRLFGLYENRAYDLLVTSHEYYPLGVSAEGDRIPIYLKKCQDILAEILDFCEKNKGLSHADMAELYNSLYPERPPIGPSVCQMAERANKEKK